MSTHDVVVIGTSVGGLSALSRLCGGLPADLPASIFVVQHVGAYGSALPEILRARGPLDVVHPVDGEQPVKGRIYVAPPDRHMLLRDGEIRLTHGPKEHHTRPAVDPLFRSAALAYGPRVIGVILTGHLDDGTFGLQAIKQCGGIAVVQDPAEAEAPGMPGSALSNVDVDYCVGIAALADTLVDLVKQELRPEEDEVQPPDRLVLEHRSSIDESTTMETLALIAKPSSLVCPECTGSLWHINGSRPPRYRCHTGHAFSLRSLTHGLTDSTEAALWSALRALQDLELILRTVSQDCRERSDEAGARSAEAEAQRVAEQAAVVRRLVG